MPTPGMTHPCADDGMSNGPSVSMSTDVAASVITQEVNISSMVDELQQLDLGLGLFDLRDWGFTLEGTGCPEPPPEPEKATFTDLISDLNELLNALAISKVFLIAKDFGAGVSSHLCPSPLGESIWNCYTGYTFCSSRSFLHFLNIFLKDFICQDGWNLEELRLILVVSTLKQLYGISIFSSHEVNYRLLRKDQEIMDIVDSSTPLPPWFTEEDLESYGSLYTKSGFQTALKVPYRSINEEFNIANLKVEAPALLIMGMKDYVLKFPGMEDYVRSGQAKMFVPKLETTYLPEGSHFVQEQFPDQVNQLTVNFLISHSCNNASL
ncbi:alpha/beta-hydrolase superfamily protein [Forsythia ovata]|uniref:Alpha/beta-hydrolase superfamily protein n=1 Tax=Forsythia ovata TaxID=205694 RepID=A0ABD1R6I7_9LAMI